MTGLRVEVLGPVQVAVGDSPLAVPGIKARSVLTVLALDHDRAVSRGEIVTAVWGEDHPTGADHSLQQHVSTIRKLLDGAGAVGADTLSTRPPGYLLRLASLDADEFEEAAGRGLDALGAGRAEAALAALDEAAATWRGPALADLRDADWFTRVATRLEERRLTVTEARAEALIDLGRDRDAVAALDPHISSHPYRERARALHMLALYRSGRQADALASFQVARTRLGEDLGLEPGKALARLESAILAQDPSLAKGHLDGVVDLHETFRADGPRSAMLRLPDGQMVSLTEGATLIGRVPEARIRLSDSRVSRRHAQVDSHDGRHVVRDLGSTNGTSVNGDPADGQDLADGDRISVGGLELTFTVGGPAAGGPRGSA